MRQSCPERGLLAWTLFWLLSTKLWMCCSWASMCRWLLHKRSGRAENRIQIHSALKWVSMGGLLGWISCLGFSYALPFFSYLNCAVRNSGKPGMFVLVLVHSCEVKNAILRHAGRYCTPNLQHLNPSNNLNIVNAVMRLAPPLPTCAQRHDPFWESPRSTLQVALLRAGQFRSKYQRFSTFWDIITLHTSENLTPRLLCWLLCNGLSHWTLTFAMYTSTCDKIVFCVKGPRPCQYWKLVTLRYLLILCKEGFSYLQAVVGSMQQAIGTLIVLILYGLAAIPLVYCCSQYFTSVPTAQVCISTAAFISGACAIIAVKVSILLQTSHTSLLWCHEQLGVLSSDARITNGTKMILHPCLLLSLLLF